MELEEQTVTMDGKEGALTQKSKGGGKNKDANAARFRRGLPVATKKVRRNIE